MRFVVGLVTRVMNAALLLLMGACSVPAGPQILRHQIQHRQGAAILSSGRQTASTLSVEPSPTMDHHPRSLVAGNGVNSSTAAVLDPEAVGHEVVARIEVGAAPWDVAVAESTGQAVVSTAVGSTVIDLSLQKRPRTSRTPLGRSRFFTVSIVRAERVSPSLQMGVSGTWRA